MNKKQEEQLKNKMWKEFCHNFQDFDCVSKYPSHKDEHKASCWSRWSPNPWGRKLLIGEDKIRVAIKDWFQDFLKRALKEQKQEFKKMVKEMERGRAKGESKEWEIHYRGYDEAIKDILNKL